MFGVEQRVWLRYFLQWKVPLTSFQVKGEASKEKRSSCLKPKAEFAASPKRANLRPLGKLVGVPFFGSFFGQAKNEKSWLKKSIAVKLRKEQKNLSFQIA